MTKKIIMGFATLIALMLVTLTSCDNEVTGTKMVLSDEAMYSFASSAMNSEVTKEDNGVIAVPVYRGNTEGSSSVTLTAELDDAAKEVFTLENSTVSFNPGQGVAYANLKFNFDDLGPTDKYSITLSIAENNQSPSAEGTIKVSASRKLTWESIGVGHLYSDLFGEDWDQPVEKAKEGNLYRLPDAYYTGYPLVFGLSDDGQTLTNWDPQPMGYNHSTYGMVYFRASAMERKGNVLYFTIDGLVVYNGKLARLWADIPEILVLPD